MKNPYLLVALVALSLHHIPAAEAELTCSYPQRKIIIEIETDGYGIDTSWEFRIKDGPILAQNERTYDLRDSDSRELCIDDGRLYELTVRDDYGDGMCCNYGKGSYKIITESDRTDNGKETILHGGKFDDTEITHLINTTKPYLSQRDQEWLDAHNTRRKTWHAHYDKSYVPLQWSEALVTEAQEWAIELLSSCKDGMYHDPDRQYGENVASNAGMGKWAVQRTPDQVMTRFVEMEVDDPWPANGHLTQALWRASNYVGCAEAHTYMTQYGKAECHTQVCRYARTGNCNMKPYISKNGKETGWIEPMLEDDNYCGPICPPDGCKA